MFAVGAFADNKKLYCYFSPTKKRNILLAESENAEDFSLCESRLALKGFSRIHLGKLNIGQVAVLELNKGGLKIVVLQDSKKWKTLCQLKGVDYTSAVIVSDYQINGNYIMYLGGKNLRIASSHSGKRWRTDSYEAPHIPIKYNEHIEVDLVELLPSGILLCYRLIRHEDHKLHHQVHLVIFDRAAPDHIVWRSSTPIWEDDSYEGENCLGGVAIFHSQLFGFWNNAERGINLVRYPVTDFDGASPLRAPSTSSLLDNFLNKRWFWQRPVLISPPGVIDKSIVIFSEKISGKYVIMHRIFPNILIDYEVDLDFDGSRWLKGQYHIPVRRGMWDSHKIGAGAPPLKMAEGWLLIYYGGADDHEDYLYKIGAMLLDLTEPARVLYRSSSPILESEVWHEISSFKPRVAYPCGAVIVDGKLLVYYGRADGVISVVSIDLEKFLQTLKLNHEFEIHDHGANP